MLVNWDFADPEENGSLGQVNRQKSARNLEVVSVDAAERSGVFYDKDRKRNIAASLERCECSDFNFAGKNPRKSFRPCMHIYRLAIELGLLEAKYTDYKHSEGYKQREAERRLVARQHVAVLIAAEDARLRLVPRDPGSWGRWRREVHESGLQLNRQYRAFAIVDDELDDIHRQGPEWLVHSYPVDLEGCGCADFRARHLPCKHIYAVAIVSNLPIGLAQEEYRAARQAGFDLLYRFD
jgi:hypothetical protein